MTEYLDIVAKSQAVKASWIQSLVIRRRFEPVAPIGMGLVTPPPIPSHHLFEGVALGYSVKTFCSVAAVVASILFSRPPRSLAGYIFLTLSSSNKSSVNIMILRVVLKLVEDVLYRSLHSSPMLVRPIRYSYWLHGPLTIPVIAGVEHASESLNHHPLG